MGAYYFDQAQNSISNITIPKSEFILYQNYPNPFSNSTTISFFTTKNSKDTNIEIYNVKGQLVRTLLLTTHQSPLTSLVWDGKDKYQNQVSSGIYLYRIRTDDFISKTKKMIIIR
jgi:flagellar hook assembly protein FlgD